jgi:hypothetical protein
VDATWLTSGIGHPEVARFGESTDPTPREVAGAVLEVGGEHLVARAEVERSGGDVDARRRVRAEREICSEAPR